MASTNTSGYIYLINAERTNLYKIGLTTRNPYDRLKELNGKQSPHNLKLINYVFVSNVNATEKHLHKQCESWHYHHEWFRFPDSIVQQVIRVMNEMKYTPRRTTNYSPKYDYQQYDYDEYDWDFDLGDWMKIAAGALFILSLLVQCGKFSNPEYARCRHGGGGTACERILEQKK